MENLQTHLLFQPHNREQNEYIKKNKPDSGRLFIIKYLTVNP